MKPLQIHKNDKYLRHIMDDKPITARRVGAGSGVGDSIPFMRRPLFLVTWYTET